MPIVEAKKSHQKDAIPLSGLQDDAIPLSGLQDDAIPLSGPEDKAATTIQKYFRGHLARKPYLPSNLYPQYDVLCKRANGPESHSIPVATGGKTRVYLPREMPGVVLKQSGRIPAITRFHQMQEVRSILDSQHSSHLIIPKANLCQNFLVEQKLPINGDDFHNMEIYLSQPKLFDEAVRELTRFFSTAYLGDLVDYRTNPYTVMSGTGDKVRYDNLPLYVVEKNGQKEGNIGLIDLEHMQKSPDSNGLPILVRIFPLHLDVIKNEASKLKMKVNERVLDANAENGRKYLQVVFLDHLEWLKQRGVSTNSSLQPFQEVSPHRTEKLTTLLEKELLKLNLGVNDLFVRKGYPDKPQKNFFIKNPEETAKELAASIAPLIISNIKAELEKDQNQPQAKIQTMDMTESQLLLLRSPLIKYEYLYQGVIKLLSEDQKIKFERNGEFEKPDIAKQLLYVMMKEFVEGGEIFYFDLESSEGNCWIRY